MLLILYLDTSVLVVALTRETKTERLLNWLAAQEAEQLAISDWVAGGSAKPDRLSP